ncbi:MAG: NAD(P)/FAD-dependent oxidoreductase [Nitrososphaerota archaeon]|nr:NAD(P)/FAD-dependent oxidoreductase [Nitrososphaerota archaeon]MDG6923003.1 NAD(P)/FAD-dependent oxidoreductase [Nitrososphaerota archaeon]
MYEDLEFDGLIIGAGHNGLVLGTYLAKCGLKILVLEGRSSVGGMTDTMENHLYPGFYHNLHSNLLRDIPLLPWYNDLELWKYGLKLYLPPVNNALPLSDGRALVTHGDVEATVRSMSKFSKKDGESFRKLYSKHSEMYKKVIFPEVYSPPLGDEERESLLRKSGTGREFLELDKRTGKDIVYESFEDDVIRTYELFMLATRMYPFDVPKMGWCVPAMTYLGTRAHLAIGGTKSLAHALSFAFCSHGGTIWLNRRVKRIVIKDGAATGVQLADGTTIGAKRFIVGATETIPFLLKIVGEENLGKKVVKSLSEVKGDPVGAFSVFVCVNEPPKFSSDKMEPLVDEAYHLGVGFEDTDTISKQFESCRKGTMPKKLTLDIINPSLFDTTQAPSGKGTFGVFPFPIPSATKDKLVEEDLVNQTIEMLREYAPNMNKENIIHSFTYTGEDIVTRMPDSAGFGPAIIPSQIRDKRPIPECSSYRTPIKNLYISGAGTHPHGNVTGAPGYNAANIIAQDLGLKIWWNPPDVRRLWSELV